MECFKGWGLLGLEQWICNSTDPTIPLTTFNKTMTVIISVVTISAGLWFILNLFINAFKWLSSNGEKQGLEAARKGITNSVIGLFLVVFAYALTSIIGAVFGIRNILNPAELIYSIWQ
jgi:hypothetical protein